MSFWLCGMPKAPDIFGPYGLSVLFQDLTCNINRLQSGYHGYHCAVVMLLEVMLLIHIVGLWGFYKFLLLSVYTLSSCT